MKLPTSNGELLTFYSELVRKCGASREDRKKNYSVWRAFFMNGTSPVTQENIVNKIYPHIDQLTALMYSGETTRFSIDLPVSASDIEKGKIAPMQKNLNENWHLSNTDLVFGSAMKWSFCYATMLVKLRVKSGQIEPFCVEPGDFGVLREDVSGLDRQEAFCHWYLITEDQLRRDLQSIPHPRTDAILKAVTATPRVSDSGGTQVIDQIVTSQSQPNMIGNVNFDLEALNKYKPRVDEKLVQMVELYVYDDAINDYRIVTMADPMTVIFDRPLKGLFLPNDQPFIQVCPNPLYDYFWGESEVDRLIPLQKMRNVRVGQIMHLLNLQAHPPKFGSGFQGDISEIADTLDTQNGVVGADMPGAKMESMAPDIPEDLYKEVREIDGMFEEASGITNIISGKGEQGVRSQGHASNLARLGSSRAKKRALIVEDQLEKIATLFTRLLRAYSKDRMQDAEGGLVFIGDHFPEDFIVKVDAHSNSPIFQEDQRQLAFELFKAKAIDRESLLELLDVPMKELLKLKLKKIEAAEQQAHQAEQAAQSQGKPSPVKAVK